MSAWTGDRETRSRRPGAGPRAIARIAAPLRPRPRNGPWSAALSGMRSVYSQVSDAVQAELTLALQERWAASLRERAQLAPHSIGPVLDTLLAAQPPLPGKIRSHSAPQNRDITREDSLTRAPKHGLWPAIFLVGDTGIEPVTSSV